ncbi:MAG: PEP-CTERM sorting domain-containing protein [Planctomycetota bacterium]
MKTFSTSRLSSPLCSVGSQAYAGMYSASFGDASNPYDPGVPGWVGPDGDGKVGGNNVINPIFVGWATGYQDYLPAPGVQSGFQTPDKALGAVNGDNLDIVSLGDLNQTQINQGVQPGQITLTFDLTIVNGDGADFAVFENSFTAGTSTFAELAYVEVSTDGTNFARFPSVSLTAAPNGFGPLDATNVYNLAGKHVHAFGSAWGTPFDLASLVLDPLVVGGLVDLMNIHYVRIVDIPGSGNFLDSLGNPIYDAWVTTGSGGFDLAGVGLIHAVPEVNSLVMLGIAGVAVLAAQRSRAKRAK